jgi:hypothetical protein
MSPTGAAGPRAGTVLVLLSVAGAVGTPVLVWIGIAHGPFLATGLPPEREQALEHAQRAWLAAAAAWALIVSLVGLAIAMGTTRPVGTVAAWAAAFVAVVVASVFLLNTGGTRRTRPASVPSDLPTLPQSATYCQPTSGGRNRCPGG